ncbi:chromosome segregation protein ScpA [Candidatus Desantisbacteria bacterium CG_4_10_14_0_8_um_filter_48_22]|uniref:Segregation and condensation protein A n=1 Tax=Candidatus Desantisbacteria bacterium CG_4_10_14_0_8_um_filter_48_22 TaxID=1974543 RepID=A0A2M7S524_9BACT|nr:MAG: hypothetical protein AUJ67_00770 [Candidatus Desantisbacteria bacterium CG1_02_49_89]PIV55275.1 MAG: chromosome segregation protein ScpA [Candidatus Desantisbacteria bacterium CG02_land_8_20_14_3_00_49_13]PIZ14646.1 MAG: chromosome segregation protein ScpA [Candidatus Desantisbacteria bacterium CG_4_10_14_0_8_um_filter_48_22]PJB27236.1 MAG: chromosome segregation protein ScpA [Candidatus Desantisbacteria bacterium CG_4_9_14_3_um_filter_50_7]
MALNVKANGFEGPIELLFELVKKNEVDIYEVWIAKITSQYLEHLSAVNTLDVEEALEFMVIAASLVYLKSKALLPKEPVLEAEEQQLQESLEKQVQEYEKYKQVAEGLKEKAVIASQMFPRPVPEGLKEEEYVEASLFDLVAAFKTVLTDVAKRQEFTEIARDTVTVEQKMEEISRMLAVNPVIKFTDIFKTSHSRIEIIVSFLALLELILEKIIRAVQKKMFADIELIKIQV